MSNGVTEPITRTVVGRIEGIRRRAAETDSVKHEGGDGAGPRVEVLLSIDESAYLLPGAVDTIEVFESVQQAELYMYLDLDGQNFIQSFAIADAGFVTNLTPVDGGHLVQLEDGAAIWFVPPRAESTDIVKTIKKAESMHQPVALRFASICGTVVDARIVAWTSDMSADRASISAYVDLKSLTAVTREEAVLYFERLGELTCPTASHESCVATYYILKGCQARAHRFCRELAGLRTPVRAAKKWAWANSNGLLVTPPNMPCCRIRFAVHVSVVLRASDREGFYVLDHALFTEPVTEKEWLAQLVSPGKESRISNAAAYLWVRPEQDPLEEIECDTERGLRQTRTMQHLMTRDYGPPPYNACAIKTHEAISESLHQADGSAEEERTQYGRE